MKSFKIQEQFYKCSKPRFAQYFKPWYFFIIEFCEPNIWEQLENREDLNLEIGVKSTFVFKGAAPSPWTEVKKKTSPVPIWKRRHLKCKNLWKIVMAILYRHNTIILSGLPPIPYPFLYHYFMLFCMAHSCLLKKLEQQKCHS